MVQIILAWSDECREKAKAAGFVERTVLIKDAGGLTNDENKARLESELFKIRPYQFLVSSYWGMGNE